MNLTLSPQIKILGLVGLLAAIGLMATMTLIGHSSPSANDVTSVPRAPRRHTATPTPAAATPKPAKTKTHTATTAHTATKPSAKAHGKRHATPTPAKAHVVHRAAARPAGNRVYGTLPVALQWQLSQHKVVVVSTYDPNAEVDGISVAEAHAGAGDAKAGFLLVNVLDNAVAGPLTALLPGGGLLPDPGVLVYRAPGNIAFRFNGFVDRATVAQAAANAAGGEFSPPTAG